jgi:hypothetical protein
VGSEALCYRRYPLSDSGQSPRTRQYRTQRRICIEGGQAPRGPMASGDTCLLTERNDHGSGGGLHLRACLASNRVGLGEAKSASFTRVTASYELFLRGRFLNFRSVLPKGAIGDRSFAYSRTPKGLSLTFTKQALRHRTGDFRAGTLRHRSEQAG